MISLSGSGSSKLLNFNNPDEREENISDGLENMKRNAN